MDNIFLEKVGKVMTVEFTADTVNWDNVDPENIPKVADDYWEHPLFNK